MVELEIPDGDPWWMSLDVWPVPGSNPLGAEGIPIAGEPCYLWARVTNKGSTSVSDATVRFYWADPSVGFDRTTANLVGTSFVSLGAGETSEVLCLTPWVPEFVNDGHECILAEAFHPTFDALPATAAFDVPTDRHVAQRNLSVVLGAAGFFSLAFMVVNPLRLERNYSLRVMRGRLETVRPLAKRLGLKMAPDGAEGKIATAGIIEGRCPDKDALRHLRGDGHTAAKVRGNGRQMRQLVGTVEGGDALVHVEQWDGKRRVGGLSVLVLAGSAIREPDQRPFTKREALP